MAFARATRTWFDNAFAAPTPVQARGWEQIATGSHTLLIAPTGSGKTLAAFLYCMDRLITPAGAAGDDESSGVRVLYVSPLKALVYDIERNLRAPLLGIARVADALGERARLPLVGVRTGDTGARERRHMRSRPPEILATTPESLYLLLGSQARESLRSVDTIIVDEVHALAPTKRGAHLALSLERLACLAGRDPQRIGLSATARPLETVARFLGGDRQVAIVDASATPAMDLEIVVPMADMTRPEETATSPLPSLAEQGESLLVTPSGGGEQGVWPAIYPELIKLIKEHHTTIVFVNSRGLCERLTQRLNDLAGEDLCRSHHGSVAHEERRAIEEQLKAGQLRAIVATSSLELGIDMGAVDLVILVESPGSVASGLQRVGRAGHAVNTVSIGRIFPKHRGDLLEAAVVAARMREGLLEPIHIPENPLDVLAQQIVAAVAVEEWELSLLQAMVRRCANFTNLPNSALTAVLDMLSGLYPSHAFAELTPRLVWDRQTDRLSARRGAKLLSLVSGGTIPDRGTYGVFLADGGARVGELDEEMVHETIPGQVFTLGASSWRVERITRDQVLVRPAPGEIGKLPFWRGESPGRPVELGRAVGQFIREIEQASERAAVLAGSALDPLAQKNLLAYLDDQREASGILPTDRSIVVERFRDELGDWRVCLLSPFGARVHAPWAMAIEAKLSAVAGFQIQTMWSDDGIVLRFADSDELPPLDLIVPEPEEIDDLLLTQLGGSALFASQFRENAARSLLMPRQRPGARTPLWVQRLKAQELLAVAREFPSFPVIMETYRSCLKDVFDVPALVDVLGKIRARDIRVTEVETRGPSPFARSLVFAYVAAYLYEGDMPLAERRAQALSLDRNLLRELLGQEELRELLDADVMETLEEELQSLAPDRKASHIEQIYDLLRRLGDLTAAEVEARCVGDASLLLEELVAARRILALRVGGEPRYIVAEDAGLYRDALGCLPPGGVPEAFLAPVANAGLELLQRFARTHVPFTAGEITTRYRLPEGNVVALLDQLASSTRVARGAFRPGGHEQEWCDVTVLRRIKRRTLAKLRNQVAPVDASTVARFLPAWHGIGDGQSGLGRLREAIVQLEGLPLPLHDLETQILPARVKDFHPRMLDELGAGGWLTWVGHGAIGNRDGKIALYRRSHVHYLFEPVPAAAELGPLATAILDQLEQRGACFFVALRETFASASLDELMVALRELVWAGQITNDTFQPLRARGPLRGGSSRGRQRQLLEAVGGRWSTARELARGRPEATERAHARVTQLLGRHGLVSREVQELEPVSGGFSATYEILRQMEELGKIRRGYFVEGLGGAQFALPGAVDRLRAASGGQGQPLVLSATDPANPFGWLLPWPVRSSEAAAMPRRVSGALIAMVDGEAVLYFRPGTKHLITFPCADEPATLLLATAALGDALKKGRHQIRVERIDGGRASHSPLAEQLNAAGFRRTANGFERELR